MLQDLTAAVSDLVEADPVALAPGETIQALHRELERLTAVVTRAVAAFDAGRAWEADGARSSAAWISTRCCQPLMSARRRVRLGRALRAMPASEEAWLAGEVGEAKVEALAAVRRRVGGDLFDRDEEQLVEHARTMAHREFAQVLAYWEQAADPDGVEDAAQAQRDGRRVHLSQTLEGMWLLDGVLDPISGEIVSRALGAIEQELFEAEWAEAKRPVRTPAQRRADALVEMARRAGTVPDGARLPRPLVTVLVGFETFAGRVCELASGAVVTPGSLLPWLTETLVERVVFEGPDRVKNVGVRRRLFTGATRRAVEVRDRECFSEFCDQPAEECQIDHVEPYGEGGLTTDDNGRPACGYHNRRRHQPP